MFKVFRNINHLSLKNVTVNSCFKVFSNSKNFSGGHHSHSDSDHDDHHHEHHTTSSSEASETEDHLNLLRKRAFSKVPKKFSVDEILEKAKAPITKAEEKINYVSMFQNEDQYINFLANEFEKKAILKYPDYKKEIESFKHRIINFDRLNAYQKEVQTLNLYLLNKLDKDREDLTKAFQGNLEGTPLEQAKSRLNLMKSM